MAKTSLEYLLIGMGFKEATKQRYIKSDIVIFKHKFYCGRTKTYTKWVVCENGKEVLQGNSSQVRKYVENVAGV